jgi:large subunit ribosomal protein L19e
MVVNIAKKRELVARILNVGANRVRFEPDRLEDIADSITRENIRSLVKSAQEVEQSRNGLSGRFMARAQAQRRVRRLQGLARKQSMW